MGLDSGYEPLFLLDSKEGKLLVRNSRKRSAHCERHVSVANGFLVIYTDEWKERTLKVAASGSFYILPLCFLSPKFRTNRNRSQTRIFVSQVIMLEGLEVMKHNKVLLLTLTAEEASL